LISDGATGRNSVKSGTSSFAIARNAELTGLASWRPMTTDMIGLLQHAALVFRTLFRNLSFPHVRLLGFGVGGADRMPVPSTGRFNVLDSVDTCSSTFLRVRGIPTPLPLLSSVGPPGKFGVGIDIVQLFIGFSGQRSRQI
jgi:hypothetical protein